jgi:hypothetical protein
MPDSNQVEEARKKARETAFEVLKTAAEVVEKIKPLLPNATKKVEEALLLFKQSGHLFNEVKKEDPIPVCGWKKAHDLCIKATIDLHTARDLENTVKVNLEQAERNLVTAKQNYEKSTKEPQAEILPFPRRNTV